MSLQARVEMLGAALAEDRAPVEAVRTDRVAWVVVVAKPGQEKLALSHLHAQRGEFGISFKTYLPLKLAESRFDKARLIAVPFFPRYLFARVDLRVASWRRIWSTRGVQGIMGSSPERPFGVADWVIERLQAQEEAGFLRIGLAGDQPPAPLRAFNEGEVVRMAGSPLEAVFLEPVDARRAAILVSLLGRDSRVTVDLAKLRSARG